MKPPWFSRADNIHRTIVSKIQNRTPYSDDDGIYLTLGVAGEAGEVADVVKKLVRQDFANKEEFLAKLREEMADLRIYLELLAHCTETDLDMEVERKLQIVEERWRQKGVRL